MYNVYMIYIYIYVNVGNILLHVFWLILTVSLCKQDIQLHIYCFDKAPSHGYDSLRLFHFQLITIEVRMSSCIEGFDRRRYQKKQTRPKKADPFFFKSTGKVAKQMNIRLSPW